MAKRESIPLNVGGQWKSSNFDAIPEGYVVTMQNMVLRDGPLWVKRAPLEKDNGTTFSSFVGYTLWADRDNGVSRLVAFNTNGANTDIYIKGTSDETYSSAVTGINVTGGPLGYTNYRGVQYVAMGTIAHAFAPLGLFAYDGTAVRTNPLGGETLYSVTIASYGDRLFLGWVKASVENKLGTTVAYDSTNWSATNVTTANITNGSTVISRIIPTDTDDAAIYETDVYTVAASTSDTVLNFRSDLRNTSPDYEMPMTTEIYYSQVWVADTVMAVGAIRVPTTLNGYRYRVTAIAGDFKTDAVTEPTWPTTIGSTVVDDQVTWICDGKEEVASRTVLLPTLTEQPKFTPTWCVGVVPANPASTKVGVRIKFGTPTSPSFELHAVDISRKDGLADGVETKKNYGQQLTVGKFSYPFFNQESSATATVDLENDVYWTDVSDPTSIDGNNFLRLSDAPGKVRGMAVVANRLVIWKERGMWVFHLSEDPDNPLVREEFFENVGLLYPRAWVVFEDHLYFMGRDGVYEYSPGGEPQELLGEPMRRQFVVSDLSTITTTVGSATTVTIDPQRQVLYVPGRANWYTYNIKEKAWAQHTSGASPFEGPKWFIWNNNTNKLYGATLATGASGPFVYDPEGSVGADSYGTQTTGTATITLRPLAPRTGRVEMSLDEVGVWASQTAGTFTVAVADDYLSSKSNSVTLLSASRTPVALRQLVINPTITFTHTGNFGASAFQFQRAEAIVRVLGPERVKSVPTQGSASL